MAETDAPPADTDGGSSKKDAVTKQESHGDGDGFFSDRRMRLLVLSAILILFQVLAFAWWLESDIGKTFDRGYNDTSFEAAWQLHAAGLFFTFFGLVAIIILQVVQFENLIVNIIVGVVVIAGGIFYFIGGCTMAGSYNEIGGNNSTSSAGIYFGWALFYMILAIIIGADVIKNVFASEKARLLAHMINIAVSGLVLFFSYATLEESRFVNYDNEYCIAAGWFFAMFVAIVYLIVLLVFKSHAIMVAKGDLVNLVFAILLIFGLLLVTIGLWCSAGDVNWGGSNASKLESYYIALSFLVLLYCIYICFDMRFGAFIK